MRRKTRVVKIGNIFIGGDFPIRVQSMTKVDTKDLNATIEQIKLLENAGCEIVRVAVPDSKSANNISMIKKQTKIPIVADIHFDYKLALKAIENGVDKLRINPGNIGNREKVKVIVSACKERKIPIRIGVNSGSLEKNINGNTLEEKMINSALKHIKILEDLGFFDIVISLKSTDVLTTVKAYELLAKDVDYPFHIGITEAGTVLTGAVKSAIGISMLLKSGIGDTIRVSLSSKPVDEVKVAYTILKTLNLRKDSLPEIISCPTCGRCEIDLINLATKIEDIAFNIKKPLKIAVMGCAVNGPGEAKEADIGVAAGKKIGLIFVKGKIIKKVKEEKIEKAIEEEIKKYEMV